MTNAGRSKGAVRDAMQWLLQCGPHVEAAVD